MDKKKRIDKPLPFTNGITFVSKIIFIPFKVTVKERLEPATKPRGLISLTGYL